MYALILLGLMGDDYSLPQTVPASGSEVKPSPFHLRLRRVWEPVYRRTISENEERRTAALFSTSGVSVSRDTFLGNSLSSSLIAEVGAGLPRVSATVNWFPVEGVSIEMGFDLIQFKLVAAVTYRPE
jgi:hypothetical protein